MNRLEVLEKMRDDYRSGDLPSLKRKFVMSQWLLTNEDKAKIQMAIDKLEGRSIDPLVYEALALLGGRIIYEDKPS